MAYRTLLGFIFFPIVFCVNAWAEAIQLNPSHPENYTVVEGDTLWDISGKFLKNPSQWPQLWSYNSQIQNPHLIYPGDTIYFAMVNGRPQLSFAKSEALAVSPSSSPCVITQDDIDQGRTSFAQSDSGKLKPCIRESGLKQAVKLIPANAIGKYLTSPRIVGQNELSNAPYVIDFEGEHLIAGAGDKVYIRSINQTNGTAFTIYRPGDTYINPETNEILGFEAKYIAEGTLLRAGDPAVLSVSKANGEIQAGDRIMANEPEEIVLNYFPKPPEQNINGNIIGVLDGLTQISRYNVVVIDRGAADGLKTGHELDIFQRGRITYDPYSRIKNDFVQLPDEISGKLMVFRSFERISYALVMQAHRPIHILDKVQTP